METSRRRSRRARGFTLVETLIAVVILAIGLLGVAALLAKLSGTTTDSRYVNSKVVLASEKLEDLSKLPTNDLGLTPGGSLTADTPSYFDQVQISSNGNNVNQSVIVDSVGSAAAPAAPTSDMQLFKRRWVIEQDVPVGATPGAPPGTTGVLRITVIVIPLNGTPVERSQTFQVSMVRPI
jgi:prepilin-type N-terminal cleavage/methylation domain-containing protein